jgi:HNH endonuclease
LSQAKFSPDPFSVEHIVPQSKGGSDLEENARFSCQGCNGHKYTAVQAIDPITGETTALHNPRLHRWEEHFVWDEDFSIVVGCTAIGRAIVERLCLN